MDTDAINLARLEPSPDLLPAEDLRVCAEHVLRLQGGGTLGYSTREGLPRLRGLIAQDLARLRVPARAEDIVVTSGSQQALDLVTRALVRPGDSVLVEQTTYAGELGVLTTAGARLIAVPGDDEGPDIAALERTGSGARALYLMPNTHNPTGVTISPARREALVRWSRGAGIPLVEDDYAADLDLDGEPRPVALRALDDGVVYIGTFSKRLAPALCIGFLVVPAALRSAVMAVVQGIQLGGSALLAHVLCEFLERGLLATHLARTLPEYRRRREALAGELAARLPAPLVARRSPRGMALWLPLPRAVPVRALCEVAERHGVLVHPSSRNAADESGPHGLRLTFCREPPARLAEGARKLAPLITAAVRQFA